MKYAIPLMLLLATILFLYLAYVLFYTSILLRKTENIYQYKSTSELSLPVYMPTQTSDEILNTLEYELNVDKNTGLIKIK